MSRFIWRISTPKAGNSGGSPLDGAGDRAKDTSGQVLAKLNAVKMAKDAVDLPQNVDCASKSAILANFLHANYTT